MKNIVICCDGTNSEYGHWNTNVVKLYQAVLHDQHQLTFYDPGVGTFNYLGREVGRRVGILLGMAFGAGLQQNVEDAYRYLMEHYEERDKVFLFGFSWGAYTARALAGMLHECGLLQKGSNNLILYASKIHNSHDKKGTAHGFKKTYSRECDPYFIGVWDTVGSLGWFTRKKKFNVRLNGVIDSCYHALSIDENRRQFKETQWDESLKCPGQTIEQVWFPGSHSDVGGWNKRPKKETGISEITLQWMLKHAHGKGLCLTDQGQEMLKSSAPPTDQIVVNESWAGVWRLWSPKQRSIPEGAKIHVSACQLMEKPGSAYQPCNLPSRYKKVKS